MIMERQEHCRTAAKGLAKDLAGTGQTRIDGANRQQPGREETAPGVEQYDAEALDWVRSVERQQVLRRVARRHDAGPHVPGRHERAASELDGGLHAAGMRGPDAGDALELVATNPQQALHAPGRRKDVIGERQRPTPLAAMAQEQREQLVVPESARAVPIELLAGTILWRQVLHEPLLYST
jgi:hypothetical protein